MAFRPGESLAHNNWHRVIVRDLFHPRIFSEQKRCDIAADERLAMPGALAASNTCQILIHMKLSLRLFPNRI